MSSQITETKAQLSKSNIKLIVLPKAWHDADAWDRIIEKARVFRLFALGESPEAFSSTLAIERELSKDVWASRLADPRAAQLFAIHSPEKANPTTNSDKIEALLKNEWVARTVLVEIPENEVSKLAASKSPWDSIAQGAVEVAGQESEKREIVFVLNGVYVAPGFRHLGVGSTTVKASIDEGIRTATARGFSRIHFQVRVDAANVLAVGLYERSGFERGATEHLTMGEKEKDGVKIPPREAEILVMHRHVTLLKPLVRWLD
jgi:GNAT superfamily N-acetyltransferase